MSNGGGTVRILWDRDETAVVNIYDPAGQAATGFAVGGSPVTFPYTLSGDVSLVTDTSGTYAVSVKLNDVEIADTPDGRKSASLLNGAVLAFAPSPNDGFVSPTGSTGGVAADETAFFVATGPVVTATDGSGGVFANFVADSRHSALPEWASIVDGDIVLTEDAGTYAYSFVVNYDFDFSDTTPPDASGTVATGVSLHFGSTAISANGTVSAGSGTDAQTGVATRLGGLSAASSVTAELAPYADQDSVNIPDGVATPSVALTLTRVAQAAVLPA